MFGKIVGKDEFGNKYYENKKKTKRWIIYKSEIDASKIPNDWFSWIHFMKNKVEHQHDIKKYKWQKPHSPNLTGTDKAYHPNKKMIKLKKNIQVGKISFFLFFIFSINISPVNSEGIVLEGNYLEIKVLDKVSSKSYEVKLKILDEKVFKNISIKALKCKNSEFDDNPEITAYLQVKDLKSDDNDEVFVFNGWTFSSSPTLRPFDHPVYDIWITKCY